MGGEGRGRLYVRVYRWEACHGRAFFDGMNLHMETERLEGFDPTMVTNRATALSSFRRSLHPLTALSTSMRYRHASRSASCGCSGFRASSCQVCRQSCASEHTG